MYLQHNLSKNMNRSKKENKRFYIVSIISLLFIFGIILFLIYIGAIIEKSTDKEIDGQTYYLAPKNSSAEKMSIEKAMEIAKNSECVKEGNLTKNYVYNNITKTWWIDLDIEKPGCHPACVVDVETKTARINWRCTGLKILPKNKFCGFSTYGICKTDKDCIVGGCSGQVCRSVNEESVITTCEYRECYDASKYGLSCKCVKGKCQWI